MNNKTKYVCIWTDSKNIHVTETDCLEGIFENVIGYCDQHAKLITIEQKDDNFILSYVTFSDEFDSMWDEEFWQEETLNTSELVLVACKFEANFLGATYFLNALARANNRQDQFRVFENN
ncbi:hypothetical protein LGN04_28785 [Burkholderia multivorans]|nr:hypothetical protein [Burkholderia multivorans]